MNLPPLECLRVFEAAARHESFSHAANELCVTPAAVAHRVKTLEQHLGVKLFERLHRGVLLNKQGVTYLGEIQRILADIHSASQRLEKSSSQKRLKIISIEVFAEKWLMPKLASFNEAHPDIVIDLHVDYHEPDPTQRNTDIWISYAENVREPLIAKPLLEETLFPVCSPSLLEAHGTPGHPRDLLTWPMLYDFQWIGDWGHWYKHYGELPPNLSAASGFRLYSTLIQGAVNSMGIAVGHSAMIARELEDGCLISPFAEKVPAPLRYLLITTPASQKKQEVQAFQNWIFEQTCR